MFDPSDPRAGMASYGAVPAARPTATEFAPAEYARFSATDPQQSTPAARTWYARGQNLVVAYSEVASGADLSRQGQPDEYVLLLPQQGAPVEVTAAGETRQLEPYSITFVPPGDSRVRALGAGRLIRLFSTRSEDLATRCVNAASYARPHPNVAPPQPWPDPVGGFALRTYSLDVPSEPGRFGRIFRCTTIMVNYLEPTIGPRDTTKMSPHSHDDFEQLSLALDGEYVHHIRFPWTANLSQWIEDEHVRLGTPSLAIIPPPSVHTSQALSPGVNQLVDIFSPPRADFSEKPGWVLNAADYPEP